MKLLAALVAALLIVLMPLVDGRPIDPSTPGFWDDGDFDDVILFLSSHLHLIEPEDLPDLSGCEVIIQDVVEGSQGPIARGSYERGSPRAPPSA